MQFGVTFPQTEIGADPVVIRDYAQTAEGLGATHISINTMGAGFTSPGEHIEAIRRYKEAIAG